jgi:hypothetical protein
MWQLMKRIFECLLVQKAFQPFANCHEISAAISVFYQMSELEQFGLLAIGFLVASSVLEFCGLAAKLLYEVWVSFWP